MKIKIPHTPQVFKLLLEANISKEDAQKLLGTSLEGYFLYPDSCWVYTQNWAIPSGAWHRVEDEVRTEVKEETRYFLGQSGLLHRVQNGKVMFIGNGAERWVTSSDYANLIDCTVWLESITEQEARRRLPGAFPLDSPTPEIKDAVRYYCTDVGLYRSVPGKYPALEYYFPVRDAWDGALTTELNIVNFKVLSASEVESRKREMQEEQRRSQVAAANPFYSNFSFGNGLTAHVNPAGGIRFDGTATQATVGPHTINQFLSFYHATRVS